ncbi:hypothetical protein DPEC_G00019690 [Dallia pectoralis]|uniref:Uncharacterized protein n=1 Tax=Dallia pectoralis TaxID=75939 RepID=A0ACC2HGD8_DALPE|nr:hypothetical protein DPEC_G00019690 [Dallia pectoralis]
MSMSPIFWSQVFPCAHESDYAKMASFSSLRREEMQASVEETSVIPQGSVATTEVSQLPGVYRTPQPTCLARQRTQAAHVSWSLCSPSRLPPSERLP